MMGMGLMQTLAMRCSFCGRFYDEEEMRSERIIRALMGNTKYGICPVCKRPASASPFDKKRWGQWCRRIDRWNEKRIAEMREEVA